MYECRIGIHAVTLVDYYYNSEFMYLHRHSQKKQQKFVELHPTMYKKLFLVFK